MNAEILTMLGGGLLSLIFSYVPGVSGWFESLSGTYKRLVLLGSLLFVAIIAVLLSCVGWFDTGVSCDQAGIESVVMAWLLAIVASQSAYKLTPEN